MNHQMHKDSYLIHATSIYLDRDTFYLPPHTGMLHLSQPIVSPDV